jgi:Glycosyltransferase WbsX
VGKADETASAVQCARSVEMRPVISPRKPAQGRVHLGGPPPNELGPKIVRETSENSQRESTLTNGVLAGQRPTRCPDQHEVLFWHYWFAGRRRLQRVVDEDVRTGTPDFPFCVAWGNETWGGRWVGAPHRVLIEQTYLGGDDHRRHFDSLVTAFHDRRYVRIDGCPVFFVYRPEQLPSAGEFAELWRRLAEDAGLPGLFLIGQCGTGSQRWRASNHGFDAVAPWSRYPYLKRLTTQKRRGLDWLLSSTLARQDLIPKIYWYPRWCAFVPTLVDDELAFPSVIPNWDNTPRVGRSGNLYHGSNRRDFGHQVRAARGLLAERPHELRLLFIRSWNEWAEGNHLEPDRRYGRSYLQAFRDAAASHLR